MPSYLTHFWAKSDPYHPLWCHCLDVGAVARALLPRFGPVGELPQGWVEFLCACHDVGKIDPHFQNKNDDLAAKLRDELGVPIPPWRADEAEYKRLFRHEARSAEWLEAWLQAPGRAWDRYAAETVAKAIVGHHGDWQPAHFYAEHKAPDAAFWRERRDELGAFLWKTIRPAPLSLDEFEHAGAAGSKLSAYVIFADWIASNDGLFPYQKLPTEGTPEEYFEAACQLARDVVAQMKLDAPVSSSPSVPTFAQVWPHIAEQYGPRPMQSALEARRDTLPPGLALIEAPTGEGKTEAALYLAQIWAAAEAQEHVGGQAERGIYFALPTQATSNAMHARYASFLDDWRPDESARLLHGMAWLREDGAAGDFDNLETLPQLDEATDRESRKAALRQARSARDWLRPMRRALLGAHGVGTVDQALLAALRVKFGTLRLLGLSQKTLIIDEVHAYDEFMGVLLERLLQWCRALDVNVILLSATLSQHQKLALARAYSGKKADLSDLEVPQPEAAPYPLLSFVPREGRPFAFYVAADPKRARELRIETKPGLLTDFTATARLAAKTVAKGGCLCLLVNTVRAAQETFGQLQALQQAGELHPDTELFLFHARFRAGQRREIEDEIVARFGPDAGKEGQPERPQRAILVCTQVVEQSLDVDFDWMISQLAPLDLLLQRAGRLWRHERGARVPNEPTLIVLTPVEGDWSFGASGLVYQPEILLRSLAVLHHQTMWKLPAQFRPLIESVYRREADLGEFAARPGFGEALQKAADERDQDRAKDQAEAKNHVWIEPNPRVFEPVSGSQSEPDEEGAGESNKYFVARTRLGDESQAIFALSTPLHLQMAQRDAFNATLPRRDQKSPPRDQLIQLWEQKAGVPRWWFFGKAKVLATPLEGFAPLQQGESFARGHLFVPFQLVPFPPAGERLEWQGRDQNGEFRIVDDPRLGIFRERIGAGEAVEEGAAPLEADAGHTSV